MTNDVIINNIINDLCQRFNVAASDLVPRLQAYGMAMSLYGAIAAGVFCVVILIIAIVLVKKSNVEVDSITILTSVIESIPLVVMLCNIYSYICWKYAPEIKSIEYVMQLFKN